MMELCALSDLPFDPGAQIEVIVLVRELTETEPSVTFPLRGTFGEMHQPFEPVADLDDWGALR